MNHEPEFTKHRARRRLPVFTIACTCGWRLESYNAHTVRQHFLQHAAAAELAEAAASLKENA